MCYPAKQIKQYINQLFGNACLYTEHSELALCCHYKYSNVKKKIIKWKCHIQQEEHIFYALVIGHGAADVLYI